MPKILLTPDVLRQKSQSLSTSQATLTSTMASIKELANSLQGRWEGAAYKAFMSSYETKAQVYKTFETDIQKFADFLTDYASAMETADEGGASLAGDL